MMSTKASHQNSTFPPVIRDQFIGHKLWGKTITGTTTPMQLLPVHPSNGYTEWRFCGTPPCGSPLEWVGKWLSDWLASTMQIRTFHAGMAVINFFMEHSLLWRTMNFNWCTLTWDEESDQPLSHTASIIPIVLNWREDSTAHILSNYERESPTTLPQIIKYVLETSIRGADDFL